MPRLVPVADGARGIRAARPGGGERGDAVSHAEGPLIGKQLGSDGRAVERARHDLERTQPAFGGVLAHAAVRGHQRQEVALLEGMAHELVEGGAVGGVSVGPVLGKPVRQVARRDVDAAPPQRIGHALDELAQAVVVERGEPGQPDADQPVRRQVVARIAAARVFLLDEVERHEHAPVKLGVPLTGGSGGKAAGVCRLAQRVDEFPVVGDPAPVGAIPELGERSGSTAAARDVQVIEVRRRVRAREHDGVGRDLGDAPRHLAIGVDGGLDARLAPMPDPGNDQRRMRNGKCGAYRHKTISSEGCLWLSVPILACDMNATVA